MKFLLLMLSIDCHAGLASWYYPRVPNAMVCATYEYPINTLLRVTDVHNGCSVVVRVIERGPNHRLHRDVDLSRSAFEQLNGPELGLCKVNIERIK